MTRTSKELMSGHMEIIFYCQYVWGMGHLVRSLELARALSDHKVILIVGGQPVDINLPEHVELVRLPVLYMDEKFTQLISGDPTKSVTQAQQERQATLCSLLRDRSPDVFIVELYPFGLTYFGFELEPLLEDIRQGQYGSIKTICSLRDILVEKKDPPAYEERVLQKLNHYFDALLVHSDDGLQRLDETFTRVGDIRIPVKYTGFVTQRIKPETGRDLRRELKIPAEQTLIVASAGGGRSGFKLLNAVVDACERLKKGLSLRLEVFTGPFMDQGEFEALSARSSSGIHIQRYTKRFLDYLAAADLSVSLAGYNTCMNLLVTQIPCLVYPYSRQQEQPMRVEKIKKFLPIKVLKEADLPPDRLGRLITDMVQKKGIVGQTPLNLDGAANTARYIGNLAENRLSL